jgi:hypothetical protein
VSSLTAGELATLRPVVVMGMHRSGTTMVAGLLRELGLFMGRRRGRNEEAIFFQRLNEWLLRRSGGAWDRPTAFLDTLAEDELVTTAAGEMVQAIASAELATYSGRRLGWPNRNLLWSTPWGFKDPRVCFTLAVWQRVFPGLRLINIRRHGVDVAASLHLRACQDEPKSRIRLFAPAPLRVRLAWAFGRHEHYVNHSVRCRRLRGAYDLWEEYLASAEARFDAFDGDKVALNYEDFLTDPMTHMEKLLGVAGLHVDAVRLDQVCRRVDASRAFGFRRQAELREFSEQVRHRELMQRFGYDSLPEPAQRAGAGPADRCCDESQGTPAAVVPAVGGAGDSDRSTGEG